MVEKEATFPKNSLGENIENIEKINELIILFEAVFPEEIKKIYRKYPKLPALVILFRQGKQPIEQIDVEIVTLALSEILKSDSMISIQKELLHATKELFNTLFPETNIEKWVRFQTGQKRLEGYQDILLAPAKGIERVVGGLIDMFNPQSYVELYAATRYMSGISFRDFCKIAEITQLQFQELENTKKASIGIELIFSIGTVLGSAGRISSILGKYTTLAKIIGSGGSGLQNLKVLERIFVLNKTLLSLK